MKQVENSAGSGNWGRAWEANLFASISSLLIMLATPLLVFYFYIACAHHQGSLWEPISFLINGKMTFSDLLGELPPFSWKAAGIFAAWFSLQLVLALAVPDMLHKLTKRYRGGLQKGAVTPAGNQQMYQINGMQAWIISHLLFVVATFGLGLFSPSIILDNWGSLLWVVNIVGNGVALFVYIKAYLFPTYAKDRKFSGNFFYDFYMGIELNPRIGKFDFKLFFNGRPGIIAWTLINISFAAAQYQMYGYVTNSMIIVNLLQAIYVIDFFWNEAWYLNTIDMCHEHFGWMLAWGDSVWLPYMYTLQGLYLVYNPVQLPNEYALFVFGLGVSGYLLFRSVNNQKERFRNNNGDVLIWGKKPEYIPCTYRAADGEERQNKLLVSGWWGFARHFNYTGDLIGSLAYCLACGFGHILPYFYFAFMTILLVHRCIRDEHRCQNKYGTDWDTYCSKVRYRLIPGIF